MHILFIVGRIVASGLIAAGLWGIKINLFPFRSTIPVIAWAVLTALSLTYYILTWSW